MFSKIVKLNVFEYLSFLPAISKGFLRIRISKVFSIFPRAFFVWV